MHNQTAAFAGKLRPIESGDKAKKFAAIKNATIKAILKKKSNILSVFIFIILA